MKAQRLVLALFALICLRGSSCLRVERPYPAPTTKTLIAALEQRTTKLHSYRGEARMSFRRGDSRVSATVRMMAATGGRLRFDLVSPIDAPLATLVAADGRFTLIDLRKNRHYYGPATPCNLARLLIVRLRAEDILAAFFGSTPMIPHRRAELAWDPRAGQEVLTLYGPSERQVIRLDGRDRSWRVMESTIFDADDKVQLRVSFRNHRRFGGTTVPGWIELQQPSEAAHLELRIGRTELNLQLPQAAFTPLDAGGVPSQRVDCVARPASQPNNKAAAR